ncbi:glucose-6-phosphate dehydrogenase [Rathayibacter soli]|uniref:glucose-6-phosphate dehydrogenase n=1 Tax=Rathayibacter soli TaxID=3144168 RepID=UPI0027E45DF4|nr:glucose-6-phosphate dehydrogenase [Glaciibacter superstes]
MTQVVKTLLVLGASGDLSARLLLPALGQLLTSQGERRLTLVGAGSEEWSDAVWRARVRESFKTVKASGAAVQDLVKSTTYHTADVTKADDLQKLIDACDGTPAIYFALPPAVAALACKALQKVQLPQGTLLALEKPFGTDLRSAAALNKLVLTLVPEDQVHRIDHFLGRSMVFNMLGLRFANRILEPVWSAEHIERVDIVYDEQLGLEDRARYYDSAGALVDMIQSHLLQVMAIVAMEPPSTLSARDMRDAKGIILRAAKVWGDDPVIASRRGRYTAGTVLGHKLPSYVDEQGVDAARDTETLAEVTFEIDTWRWAGVPFTLRSGKALSEHRREIVITFKQAQHLPHGLRGVERPTKLRMLIGPDGMSLELNVNGPGDPYVLGTALLQADFGPGQLLAYGEVLDGLLDGDPALSVRGDAAEQCWRIVAPVLKAWSTNAVPIDDYRAGSRGPAAWPAID